MKMNTWGFTSWDFPCTRDSVMWDILSIGPHYRCLRQTHPSVDDIMLSCPSLHYIAVVVEVAEAELHPVLHIFVQQSSQTDDWLSQNTLPQSHVPSCPLSICKMQRPPMVRFYCDSPDSPGSTAHQVNPLCWKLLRRTDASWVLTGGLSSVDNQNRLFGGADSACSGAFAYTRKVSKGKRHQESLIIMDGEPDYF